MKNILIISVICLFLLSACEDTSNNHTNIGPEGGLISRTGCKGGENTIVESDYTTSQSCAEYTYDEATKTLHLTHINAGFNCCPGEISADISCDSNDIIITEIEDGGLCDCDCLYDLNIEIKNINAEEYSIEFIEPYAREQEPLIFTIDLSKASNGVFCVERKRYPWGM